MLFYLPNYLFTYSTAGDVMFPPPPPPDAAPHPPVVIWQSELAWLIVMQLRFQEGVSAVY